MNGTAGITAGTSRYDAFFRQLQSVKANNSVLQTLYHRTLVIESAFIWAALVAVPVCVAVGMCGNLVTLGLMLRARSRWSKPHVYIACLLPTNAAILTHQFFSQTMHRGLFSYTKGRFEFPLYPSHQFCAAWSFVMTSAGCYAMLLVVALMLDRLHALTLPFSYRQFGLRFSWRVVLGLAILSIGLASPILPLYSLSPTLVFLDSTALLPNCFVPQTLPHQRDIITVYVFAVHRGGLVSLLMLGFNAFLAYRVRQISRGSALASAGRAGDRSSARVTLLIFSLSLFYSATLTPAAAVLGIGSVYALSSGSRQTDPVGFYLNVTFLTNLGLLFNVLYTMFYGFNWIIYARDVPFVRQPVARLCRRSCLSRSRQEDSEARTAAAGNSSLSMQLSEIQPVPLHAAAHSRPGSQAI